MNQRSEGSEGGFGLFPLLGSIEGVRYAGEKDTDYFVVVENYQSCHYTVWYTVSSSGFQLEWLFRSILSEMCVGTMWLLNEHVVDVAEIYSNGKLGIGYDDLNASAESDADMDREALLQDHVDDVDDEPLLEDSDE
jgi:hypothetical protein